MENYKKMYLLLFNAVTAVTAGIADLEQTNYGLAKERLIAAQQQCEEWYMSDNEK